MDILYRIFVKGRVQGVWFRKYTCDKANELGINGIVRNEINNVVYIEAEGNSSQLDIFMKWLHKGSPLSKVTSVNYEMDVLKHYRSFKIQS